LTLPKASAFEIVSDKTERGGASELEVTDVPNGLKFKGQVGSIQGSRGPVGFALARIPVAIDSHSVGSSLSIEAALPVTISIVMGVPDELNPRPGAGTLTYSQSFPLNVGTNQISFMWQDMKATIRGRPIEGAAPFRPELAETFAIQVSRSQQVAVDPESFDPIPFDFTFKR
jgi:hypothetical protein